MFYYVIGYLILGTLILTTISVVHRMDNSEDAKSMRRINKLIAPSPKTWHEKILLLIIVPAIAVTLAVLFWPGVVVWIIKNKLSSRAYKNREKKEPEVFKVKKEHLIEKVLIEDVEAQEVIFDPLGAVPEIPFGHLNTAWQEFKEKLQSDDELWLFSANWTHEWGYKEKYNGYVQVKSNIPSDFFLATTQSD